MGGCALGYKRATGGIFVVMELPCTLICNNVNIMAMILDYSLARCYYWWKLSKG